MGNNNVFRNSKSTFLEQLKIDSNSEKKILGIFINPSEFPNSGLIIVTNKAIMNYSPIDGKLFCSLQPQSPIILCDYNRKSKEGSLLFVITEDFKLSYFVTESLTLLRTSCLSYSKMKIREHSKVSAVNFKLADTVLIGFSDGSIVKMKHNEDALNLLYETCHKKTATSDEEEFENIKSVYSTDMNEMLMTETNDNSFQVDLNSVEFLLVSSRFKVLFSFQKHLAGLNKINIFCLRNNRFERTFCKIEGLINAAKLIDKKDLIIVIVFKFETKKTNLQVWHYNEGSCPVTVFNLSSLLDYPFTIRSVSITQMPDRYYGRNTNHGIVDGDMIFLGSTRGDVLLGKILPLTTTNKVGYEPLYIYKLKNSQGEEMSNKYEISSIFFDLYFDVLIIGDVSSNVKFFEKILQIGKTNHVEDSLPFFSFFGDEKENVVPGRKDENLYSYDLPVFSVNHDVIKDRSIITYDQGRDLLITSLCDESTEIEMSRKNLADLLK